MTELDYTSLAFVSLVFGVYGVLLLVLRRGLGFGLLGVTVVAVLQLAWLGGAGALAGTGYLVREVSRVPPTIVQLVVAPPLLTALAVSWLPGVAARLRAASTDWLISAHGFRLPLALLVAVLVREERVPAGTLTLLAVVAMVAVGALALLLGYLSHKGRLSGLGTTLFHGLGVLVSLGLTVLALLSLPTPWQSASLGGAELRLPFHVPFVWWLAYLEPVAMGLNLLGLRATWLRRAVQPRARQ